MRRKLNTVVCILSACQRRYCDDGCAFGRRRILPLKWLSILSLGLKRVSRVSISASRFTTSAYFSICSTGMLGGVFQKFSPSPQRMATLYTQIDCSCCLHNPSCYFGHKNTGTRTHTHTHLEPAACSSLPPPDVYSSTPAAGR